MNSHVLEVVFWSCILGVAYHYIGYPVVLFTLCTIAQVRSDLTYLLHRHSRRCHRQNEEFPRVAVLISAYNEQNIIAAKVENCLEIDYPPDRLEFLFGLDAPSDETAVILSRIRDPQMRVFHYKSRRGKLAVLCDLAKQTSAEILVLTDANTILEAHCVKNVVRHFADSRVGAVSGEELRVAAPNAEPSGESLYWRYESALKILESRLNCSLGGNGAVLAIRHSLFKPSKESIVEDFQIPLEIRFSGYRVIYDPEAIAVEDITPTFNAQFARRVRIGAGNYQTLLTHPEYLNPLRGLLGFSFISHRLLRWLAPFLLLTSFFCSMTMAVRPFFGLLFTLQCLFYCAALLAYLLLKRGRSPGILGTPLHFCSMNLALLLGFYKYITGRQGVVWGATPRRTPSQTTSIYPAEARIAMSEAVERHPAA